MINTKLQNIIDTKSAIGNAIVNKGGTITSETPFFNYASEIDNISSGTPQSIFQANDGSKWALTNVVNLVNDAGNMTYNFNWWQPADNSTSEPLLTTVTQGGVNINGLVKILRITEVDTNQFVNLVITDVNGAKYVGYNGYDYFTNPPINERSDFVSSKWRLNNDATGRVLVSNAIVQSIGTFNGANSSLNITNMAFIGNTNDYGSTIYSTVVNNGFIYVAGGLISGVGGVIKKYHENNLEFVSQSANVFSYISGIAINNGFIYAIGAFTTGSNFIKKYHESNLEFVGNSSMYLYGNSLYGIAINNGRIFIGGANGTSNSRLQSFHEGNLVSETTYAFTNANIIGRIATFGGQVYVLAQNGVLASNRRIITFEQTATTLRGTSITGNFRDYAINNGIVYVTHNLDSTLFRKLRSSNLQLLENLDPGYILNNIAINNGFIYASGGNNIIRKFYEDNLVFVNNTPSYNGSIQTIAINNGFIYAGGETNRTVQKFQEKTGSLDVENIYNIVRIKE